MYRAVNYRLVLGDKNNAKILQDICDYCNDFWNYLLERNKVGMNEYENGDRDEKPDLRFFSLCKTAKRVRQGNYFKDCPLIPLRGVCKNFSEAWKKKFNQFGGSSKGFPKFKNEYNSFTLDQNISVRHTENGSTVKISGIKKRLVIRRKGVDQYKTIGGFDNNVKKLVIRKEFGYRWYITLVYKTDDEVVENTETIGIDRNVSNVYTSKGEMLKVPSLEKLDTNIKNKQRKLSRQVHNSNRYNRTNTQIQKSHKKKNKILLNFAHQVSNYLRGYNIILEDLETQKMKSKTGRNNKQLRKSIAEAAWTKLGQFLKYKTNVKFVDPAYTSQTCYNCKTIDKNSRKSQSRYHCSNCGTDVNADLNAAMNILARGLGVTGHVGIFPSVKTVEIEGMC